MVFSRAKGVLYQKDMSLMDYASVAAALADPDFEQATIEDTAMLLSKRGEMYALNLVAAYIWERLDGTRDSRDLTSSVCRYFDAEPTFALVHTESLLGQMKEYGLVET